MRAPYPVATMRRAIELHEAGWRAPDIQRILLSEGRAAPHQQTIRLWINPTRTERTRAKNRDYHRARAVQRQAFRMRSDSPPVRLAFMRELRSQGVSRRDIGIVHGVVYGERLTESQVRYALETAP